jgi:hypothetical protein
MLSVGKMRTRRNCLLCILPLVVAAMWLSSPVLVRWWNRPRSVELPSEDDVETMTCSLNGEGMGFAGMGRIPVINEFQVPREYQSRILGGFQPVKSYKRQVEENEKILWFKVVTKAGKTYYIDVWNAGQNPLCFTVNGVSCIRGGGSQALRKMEDGKEPDGAYLDEGTHLAWIMWQIHEELTGHPKLVELEEFFSDIERSRGARPTVIIPSRGQP